VLLLPLAATRRIVTGAAFIVLPTFMLGLWGSYYLLKWWLTK
jgi:hypothetical protein